MNAERIGTFRQRLSMEYESLIQKVHRSRLAAVEVKLENTEDEGDLAVISHDRSILYNLHEGGLTRLRFVQRAIQALERGQYGECQECGNEIAERRLEALPWATTCVGCQEKKEQEREGERGLPGTDEEWESDL